MQLETLTCNSCGAPLQVPESTNYLKCNHCSAELAVRRTNDATFTEQLHKLVEHTEQLSEQIDELTTLNEIAALDRRWDMQRESFMVQDKHGKRYLPTEGRSLAMGVFTTAGGAIWMAVALGQGAGSFAMFGLLFIGFGIAASLWGFKKAGEFRRARRRYRRQRRELRQTDRS